MEYLLSQLPKFLEPTTDEFGEGGWTSVRKEVEDNTEVHEDSYQLTVTFHPGSVVVYYYNISNGEWANVVDGEEFAGGATLQDATDKMKRALLAQEII